ncbi:hypothetical protein NLJ89_g7473 [Agrocybe chaxingu]|uniref:Uncharacterized protein n=1 Tax=Agrocybe chaxingu TaxID=84603 RepID=A0A9W8JUI3_9AGAR|nr:hypothetical protein NLJ89_g7473 [Agrocybe chaxingu]
MFKRVEKRRRKKQEEEELGLDEDMKEILGMHDTDSEESASESDSGGSSGEEDEEDDEMHPDVDAEEALSGEEDEEDEDEDAEEDPEVSVGQALKDPVYVVSVMPEVRACIVCPGKLLKGIKMVDLHRISNACTLSLAHERRLKQFKAIATEADSNESAWEILKRHSEEKPKLSLEPSTSGTSKRAEKKKARQAHLRLRREKSKEKKAQKAVSLKKTLPTTSRKHVSESLLSVKGAPEAESTSVKPKETKKRASKASAATSTLSPTKKRKLETTSSQKKPSPIAPSQVEVPQKPSAIEKSSHPEKKAKPKGEDEGKTPVLAGPINEGSKSLFSAQRKESVKDIVRSTGDRAKNARSRAIKGTKGKSSRKAVEVS